MLRTALLSLLLAAGASAQGVPQDTVDALVMSRDGHSVELAEVVNAMANADVVFLGEIHDDSLGHVVQTHLLRAAHERFGTRRPLVLGLEMFETDVQGVLDEYAAGLIRERDFLAASRPWGNYAEAYRPMVEFAIANDVPVVATNAPGRYVSYVSREGGADALTALSDDARATMPATVAPPSDALDAAFREIMDRMGAAHAGMPGMPTMDGMLAAQNLRDVTMAWALHRAMPEATASARPLAIHLNGAFHSDSGLGIPEHLARIAPGLRVMTVTIGPDAMPGRDAFAIRTRAVPGR
ncbi:MAG: ChaN family lipoprotein [Bacteroidota bacterium]